MEEILAYVKPAIAILPISKSNAEIAATAIDGTGFSRCCFLVAVGTVATDAGMSCSVTESATNGGDYTAKTNAVALAAIGTSGAGKLYAMDVGINPDKPHMKLYGTCGTAAILHSAVALLYRGKAPDPNLDTVLSQYVRKYS
jgi:hypothetical protein